MLTKFYVEIQYFNFTKITITLLQEQLECSPADVKFDVALHFTEFKNILNFKKFTEF